MVAMGIKTAHRPRGRKAGKRTSLPARKTSPATNKRRKHAGAAKPVSTASKRDKRAPAKTSERRPTIFISYRHEAPYTHIAQQLFAALKPAAESWRAKIFFDEEGLVGADRFETVIGRELDRTTHFIALLSNEYWNSDYCRKEMARVVDRFERGDGRGVRPLFVKAGEFKLEHFRLGAERRSGRLRVKDPLIESVAEVQFLGPFDSVNRLVRLQWQDPAKLSDQIASLINALERVIK